MIMKIITDFLLLFLLWKSTRSAIITTRGSYYQNFLLFALINSYICLSFNYIMVKYNYIDRNYIPLNRFGYFIQKIANSFIDIKTEIFTYTWILLLFLLPYTISYIIVGLFGYAVKIKLSKPIKYFVIFCSKSFITVIGLSIGSILSSLIFGFHASLTLYQAIIFISVELILLNTVIILFHLFISEDFLSKINNPYLKKVDSFFCRNVTPQSIPPSKHTSPKN